MGRKIRCRPIGGFSKKVDWDGISDITRSYALYWDLVHGGRLNRSQATVIRFWTCRAAALNRSSNPPALMRWLLENPEAVLTQAEEDQASQVLRGQQVRREGSDVTRIGDISRRI